MEPNKFTNTENFIKHNGINNIISPTSTINTINTINTTTATATATPTPTTTTTTPITPSLPLTPEMQLLRSLYEDTNTYRTQLISSLDLVAREWSARMPVDDASLKHAHKHALKVLKSRQLSSTNVDNFLLHLIGDPMRPTGIFNEIRLENFVRSHIYNQDTCNKIYDETFAGMFEHLSDSNFGTEYWTAQQAKVQHALSNNLKGPTSKMYLSEFNRRTKRDTAILKAFRGIYDRLDEINPTKAANAKKPSTTDGNNRKENVREATAIATKTAPVTTAVSTSVSTTSASTASTSAATKSPTTDTNKESEQTAQQYVTLLQQLEEIVKARDTLLEQVKNEVTSLLLEDMQVNALMEYVTRVKQSKSKYIQTVHELQAKIIVARRGNKNDSQWNELANRIKTLEVEEQKIMNMLQSNISLATKLMSVVNCYKDFWTLCKLFELEIEKKNEEYTSLRGLLNDQNNRSNKSLLTNIRNKRLELQHFVEQCLAKTNKESFLNRMSFILKRFEENMQTRYELNTNEVVEKWFMAKKEVMTEKELELRQKLGDFYKCLTTFDMTIAEAEQASHSQEHSKKDYIYVCLEGSQTYQLKYLCVAYASQRYRIFNDIGEEQMNKKPLFEGKCTSRFLSKMEATINKQVEKGTGFIFDEHRFFCSDFFEYRCWKSYILTGNDLRQEQLEWNGHQEKSEKTDPQNADNKLDNAQAKLRQRRASLSVM